MAENLTTLAKRLRPLITSVVESVAAGGGEGGTGIELHHAGSVTFYPNTDAGLASAIGAAAASDQIFLPPGPSAGAYTANTTIPAYVTVTGISRTATVISGKITLGAGSAIENLSVIRTANDANDLIGVDGPASGMGLVIGCDIRCTQSGAGDAFGVRIGDEGSVEVWVSLLEGSSTSGNGYAGAIDGGGGNLYQFGGRALGSTTPYLEAA